MKPSHDEYEYLAARVSYDPNTGCFMWRHREGDDPATRNFNANFAGRECGSNNGRGYLRISVTIEGKTFCIKSHRLAWFIVYGSVPDGDIDHIDGNTLNNRIDNLRDVTKSINQRNSKMQANNASGVTGVSWHKRTEMWEARASVKGIRKYVGSFNSIDEAAFAIKTFRAANGFTHRHGEAQ